MLEGTMQAGSLRILIADDDAGDRKQIKRAIQQAELVCECMETESIEDAFAICETGNFDCLIVDYRLPGQDGLAGISRLHERYPELPIVMSTGQGDEMVAAEAMRRGAADYIPKAGVNALSIRKTIDNVIGKATLQHKILQQQQELENFARVLAHDLRAPGAAIQTFATRIAERLSTGQPAKALEYAEWVIQTAARMNLLIDTLHRYTTADGKVTLAPVDMNLVLESALANLQDVIQGSGSKVTSANLPKVLGDAPQLIQLLQNLIGNGIKYCDHAVPAIHIDSSPAENGDALFSVADNGIGIPEAHLKRVFEPFVRLNGTGNRKGSGLGLATCKKVVERHGGIVWCESKPGRGTTFFFTLAMAAADSLRSSCDVPSDALIREGHEFLPAEQAPTA
jgi:signal transduction histidine kinase